MSKMKVVITRHLNQEAQILLDSQSTDLEIVQWQSDQVRASNADGSYQSLTLAALRAIMATTKCERSDRALNDVV